MLHDDNDDEYCHDYDDYCDWNDNIDCLEINFMISTFDVHQNK